ncbi:MAG: phytoene/squalene synthase family protein [Candidatus Omnitrophica bacterium]|nr:phytoene/squalene synthase family protein [Candidatus Omnitrophota bacterium]
MIQLYEKVSFDTSKLVTTKYSTSFSLGILTLDKKLRKHIYAIYGLVRIADEIVDTFHHLDKKKLLDELKNETYKSISNRFSSNLVLNSFQITVNEYKIPKELIDAFFHSMEMDTYKNNFSREDYDKYVYGSAEVVGLMCLKIFVDGDEDKYKELREYARALGSAFQKVNFLRDIGSDLNDRHRIYIPEVPEVSEITNEEKQKLVQETEREFSLALEGIKRLPNSAKLGVYSTYLYYLALLRKIKKKQLDYLLSRRVRVNNFHKILLLLKAFLQVKVLKLI